VAGLRKLIHEQGLDDCVELPGVLSGAAKWREFARADLFIFPSVAPYESFGLVLVEAMMWSLPIVATDWRGNREVFTEGDKPGGICFPPGEQLAGDLEQAIEQALQAKDRWIEWGALNRDLYERRYKADAFPRRLSDVILKLATDAN
jgi:glycosyltransferase involved in cell wall biosynthesis